MSSDAGSPLGAPFYLMERVVGHICRNALPPGYAEAPEDRRRLGEALVDVLAGQHLVIGVLAALRERERTGLGQRVDVNLLSSLLFSLVNQASAHLNAGVEPGRLGNAHPSIAPYQTVRAADRDLALAVGNDGQFGRLAAVLGLDGDPRFATNTSRVEHRAASSQGQFLLVDL